MWQYWNEILRAGFVPSLSSIGQSLGAIIFYLVSAALAYLKYFREPWAEMKKHIWRKLVQVVPVAILAWLPFYVYQIGSSVYMKQQSAEARAVTAEQATTTQRARAAAAEKAKEQLERSLAMTRSNILRSAPSKFDEPFKCWAYDHPVFPNKHMQGATHATEAIMFCNKRIEAPVEIYAEFDAEFIEAASHIMGAGGVLGGASGHHSRIVRGAVVAPPLLAYQPVSVLAHADKPIHFVRGFIRTQE